jgi:hypothetical protein
LEGFEHLPPYYMYFNITYRICIKSFFKFCQSWSQYGIQTFFIKYNYIQMFYHFKPNWLFWWHIASNKSDWKVIVISTTTSRFLLGLIILALGITLHCSKEHVRKLLKSKDPSIPFNIICIMKIDSLISSKILENINWLFKDELIEWIDLQIACHIKATLFKQWN